MDRNEIEALAQRDPNEISDDEYDDLFRARKDLTKLLEQIAEVQTVTFRTTAKHDRHLTDDELSQLHEVMNTVGSLCDDLLDTRNELESTMKELGLLF